MKIITGINAILIVSNKCFALARPMNINIMLVAPINNAVDKFAGAINMQTIATGISTGKKPFLKSFITSCFLLSNRLRYMNSASFARSEVWKCEIDYRQSYPAASFI